MGQLSVLAIVSDALAIGATKILVAFMILNAHGAHVPARRKWVGKERQRCRWGSWRGGSEGSWSHGRC